MVILAFAEASLFASVEGGCDGDEGLGLWVWNVGRVLGREG